MKQIIAFILIFMGQLGFTQTTEVLISNGADASHHAAISPTLNYVAKIKYSNGTITVWDFKSGRLVQEIEMSDNPYNILADSLWFSNDGNKIYASYYSNTNSLEYDFITGIKTLKKINLQKLNMQELNDYGLSVSNYKSDVADYIDMFKTVKEMTFYSPNKKNGITYQNVLDTNQYFNIYIEKEGKKAALLSTSRYVNFVFSADSRFLFANDFIYDFELNEKVCDLKTTPYFLYGATFFPGSNIPVTPGIDQLHIWSLPNKCAIEIDEIQSIKISDNEDFIAYQAGPIHGQDSKWGTIELKKLNVPRSKFELNGSILESVFDISNDGNYILTSSTNGMRAYKTENGELMCYLPGVLISMAYFLPNNDIIFMSKLASESSIVIYNITTKTNSEFDLSILSGKDTPEQIWSLKYDNEIIYLSTLSMNYLIDANSKMLLAKISASDIPGRPFAVSIYKNQLILGTTENRIIIYDFKAKKIIHNLSGHKDYVVAIETSQDGKYFLTSSLDGVVKFWNLTTGKELCSFISTGFNEYILMNPENYYLATKNATQYLHFKKSGKLYSVEQFDLKYNRPDLVLKNFPFIDSATVMAYNNAYNKRLKKMGFTNYMLSEDFHLPEVKLVNINPIPSICALPEIEIPIRMIDKTHQIDRINIFNNGVAIYGQNGISVKNLECNECEFTIKVPLINGKNKIQISILNAVGVESYKQEISLKNNYGKIKPDLYIVSIGVSNYKDSRYNLTYAAKDAADISKLYVSGELYEKIFTKLLINENVTLTNIFELKSFFSTANINDHVIIFIAGHGVLDANFDYYFASHDMDFQNPVLRGIPYEAIEALLDGITPLKKLLLMDTCHSGEVDKDEIQFSENKTESENDITFRNVGVAVENKENQLGLQNTSELMKSLFTDLRKGTGATVISSAGGVEFAMESDSWQNGLFTYCLINGLTTKAADLNGDKMITVSELQIYVQTEVSKLSNGKQTPTSRIQNNEMDYRIW